VQSLDITPQEKRAATQTKTEKMQVGVQEMQEEFITLR